MRKKTGPFLFSPGILAASLFWSTLSLLARIFSRFGILRPTALPCRVLSVGNIQVGGAGKTPLVAVLAKEAIARGLQVCILCRGYGGEWEWNGGVLPPAGKSETQAPGARLTGDEAALLHERVPEAWIGVGANRIAAFLKAQKMAGSPFHCVILDDGFQHWKIKKDLEILAMTSLRPWNMLFRDFRWASKNADLIVWTKGGFPPFPHGKPWIKIEYRLPKGAGEVWLVTGVADSDFVKKTVTEAGYDVKNHIIFPDHAKYDVRSVRKILEDAQTVGCRVATTGKDWVKWKEFDPKPENVMVLEPQVVFTQGKEHWDRTLWKSY